MERVHIQTAHNVALDFEVAGVGDRVLAALIDYVVLVAYFLGAVILAVAVFETFTRTVQVLISAPYFLYFFLCELLLDGQSIGKRVMTIRVVRRDGTSPSVGSYLLRWVTRPVEFVLTGGLVALVTVLVTGTGQRLGDLAAGTTVVKLRPKTALRDTILADLDTAHTITYPQVERLADADVALAKDVLNTLTTASRSRHTDALGNRAKEALARKMGIAPPEAPPVAFLRTVVADYNHHFGTDRG
jgi:uncharacterized RDD family membrane protein YckC